MHKIEIRIRISIHGLTIRCEMSEMSSPKRRIANTYASTMFVDRLVYRAIPRLTDLTIKIDDYSQR